MKRYSEWIVAHRRAVIAFTVVVTAVLGVQMRQLRVVINPASMFPQSHPYVAASNEFEEVFGSKRIVVIGVTPRQGDVFQPRVLEAVHGMTHDLLRTPGIVPSTLRSLAAPHVKSITGTDEGLTVRPLMEAVPRTPEEIAALKERVVTSPVYLGGIVSADLKTAAIVADAQVDEHGSYDRVVASLREVIARRGGGDLDVALGGVPVYLVAIESYSQRMALLFPLAVFITGLIHYEAFRTLQGLILPLVTAVMSVVWGLGAMGLAGVTLDAFNATTPILILAVAAGHAVQVLKRYYEEYHRLHASGLPRREANVRAVAESMQRIGPVMLTAGTVAALGFLSLVVFETETIRTFGIFTGLGILSALVLEMTFIPALRSLLPAPGEHESERERDERVWDRVTGTLARWVGGPRRRRVYATLAVLTAVWAVGATRIRVDNAYRTYFFESLEVQKDDLALNRRLAGTNTLYLLFRGAGEDAIKDPAVLRAIDSAQEFLARQPNVGKTVSIVDFLKGMNRAMHADDDAHAVLPPDRELISQYLLLYSMSGDPGDLDAYVDYRYQRAGVWVFLQSGSTAYFEDLVARLRAAVPMPPGVEMKVGGSLAQGAALNQVMVRGKITNILQIAAVIFVASALVFRSLVAGGLVLAPLLLAVLANFGFMGLFGIPLNIPISVISAMAVGIGADYAIYLIYRFREERARGKGDEQALQDTMRTAGKAILFVASAVGGGYGVLVFSWGFYLHIWFAILIATSMLVSSLATLTLLPSLILSLRPRFLYGAPMRTRGPAHTES